MLKSIEQGSEEYCLILDEVKGKVRLSCEDVFFLVGPQRMFCLRIAFTGRNLFADRNQWGISWGKSVTSKHRSCDSFLRPNGWHKRTHGFFTFGRSWIQSLVSTSMFFCYTDDYRHVQEIPLHFPLLLRGVLLCAVRVPACLSSQSNANTSGSNRLKHTHALSCKHSRQWTRRECVSPGRILRECAGPSCLNWLIRTRFLVPLYCIYCMWCSSGPQDLDQVCTQAFFTHKAGSANGQLLRWAGPNTCDCIEHQSSIVNMPRHLYLSTLDKLHVTTNWEISGSLPQSRRCLIPNWNTKWCSLPLHKTAPIWMQDGQSQCGIVQDLQHQMKNPWRNLPSLLLNNQQEGQTDRPNQ